MPSCKYCSVAIDGTSGVCITCYGKRVRMCPECRNPSSGRLLARYTDRHRNGLLVHEAEDCKTCNNERWVYEDK